MRIVEVCLVALATVSLFPSPASAQIPAHATAIAGSLGTPTLVRQAGDTVYALGPGSASSIDGGRTWTGFSPPGFLARDLVAGDDFALVTGRVGYAPCLARSADRGLTWSGPILLDAGAPTSDDPTPLLHIDGQVVTAVWARMAANGRVWTKRSTDGGATWPAVATALDQPTGFPAASSINLRIAADGPVLHVFWIDHAGTGFRRRQQTSLDGGLTWLPTPRTGPVLAVNGGNTAVLSNGVLLLTTDGFAVDRSTDGGVTWSQVYPFGTPLGTVAVVSLAAAGSKVVAAGIATSLTAVVAHANASVDGGATWANAWSTVIFPGFVAEPHVVGDDLYVHFRHHNQPWRGIGIHSGDDGVTWNAVQPGVAYFSPGPRRTIHVLCPQPSADPCYLYAAIGHTRLGVGTSGSGGVVPQLRLEGLPRAGGSTTLRLTAAVGGSLGVLGFALAAPTAVPFGSAVLWLPAPDVLLAFATGGAAGAAGVGSFAVPLAVPPSPSLAGMEATSQAVMIDAAGSGGFAVSNAIEIWF